MRKWLSSLFPSPHALKGVNPFDAVATLVSPPPTTNVGSDTLFTFNRQAKSVAVQNNTAANAMINFDAPASLGTWVVYPQTTAFFDVPCSILHVYTAAAQNVNGAAAAGIVVGGWL